MSYLKDFQSRIQINDYPGFLKLWEEYCYSDEFDTIEFIRILESVKRSDLSKNFGNHVEKGLTLWEKIQDPNGSHEILKLIFDIQTTNNLNLAELAVNYLLNKYPNDPNFQEKLRLIGLRGGTNFQGAISNFELLTHMKKGNFVFHNGGWGAGEILDVSLIREELSLECEYVVGVKHISFGNAFKTLVPIPDDHFLARRFGNPDLFEKQARENPIEVIRCLLRDLGPKTASEIKEELADLVIPQDDWNRWWQTARNKIKKDTKISSPKKLKDAFTLRDEEVPHEVVFYKALEAKPDVDETISMVYTFMRDFSETLKNKDFKNSLVSRIDTLLNTEGLDEAQKLQLLFFLEDLHGEKNFSRSSSSIKQTQDIEKLLEKIEIIAFKKKTLTLIRKARKDWQEIFYNMLFIIDQNLIRDYILGELVKEKAFDKLKEKIQQLLLHPITYPEVFVWYFQKILSKKSELPFSDDQGQCLFFEGFLILLDHLGPKNESRDLSKKMVSLLIDNRYMLVRNIFGKASLDEIKEYLLLATKCEVLSDHDIKIIYSLAEVVFPVLGKMRKGEKTEEEEIIWTTEQGYQKTKNRIEQIATVETVENAKEIEEARSHGDLRENSEFKFALEKRDRLQAELKLLSDQLNSARILTKADVSTQTVDVGTVVEFKNSNGKDEKFIVLGPWDADPEKNILSFQSKLAKAMKGKSRGETFLFQNEEFTITEIYSYFDEK